MSLKNAEDFVDHWINSWNARDVEAVLSHYHDDIRFFSPIAGQIVNKPYLSGKSALAGYWSEAMKKFDVLRFELDEFTWTPERGLLAMYYIANLNGDRKMVCESQWIEVDGLVHKAAAYYGSAL